MLCIRKMGSFSTTQVFHHNFGVKIHCILWHVQLSSVHLVKRALHKVHLLRIFRLVSGEQVFVQIHFSFLFCMMYASSKRKKSSPGLPAIFIHNSLHALSTILYISLIDSLYCHLRTAGKFSIWRLQLKWRHILLKHIFTHLILRKHNHIMFCHNHVVAARKKINSLKFHRCISQLQKNIFVRFLFLNCSPTHSHNDTAFRLKICLTKAG